MYHLEQFNNVTVIWYEKDGYRISFTLDNESHPECQRYLAWLEEGNMPEPWIEQEIDNGN